MTRILVVYGTTDGQTRKVALELSLALRHAGVEVDVFVASPDAPSPDVYAGVIVAASLHAGKYQRSVRRWLIEHAAGLRGKPSAFVSVCLMAQDPSARGKAQLAELMRNFVTDCGWIPGHLKPVAGALLYTRYGWLKRWILKRISSSHGGPTDTTRDHEFTDWPDVRAFARQFLVDVRRSESTAQVVA